MSDSVKNELWATLALRHTPGLGPRRTKRLLESYKSAFAAAQAGLGSPSAWPGRGLTPASVAERFFSEKWRLEAQKEWKAIRASDCSFLLWSDPAYPDILRDIPDPPLLLYYKGDTSLLRGPAVAVVGARDCTREGIAVAAFFARDLAKAGVAVISGMARGIDRAAHLAGLEGPGRSIALLGTGIDVMYPACNADLYGLLAQEGLLLSEFAPGTEPSARHFPVRNRLVSGLSRGVLVVEATGRSGSLITARLALEQNRDVFAVPGHTMAAVSEGCRFLIRQGAKAVFSAEDLLLELAPLLRLDAEKGLSRQNGAKPAPARKRKDALHVELLTGALDVLPVGGLPWIAPESCPEKHAPPAVNQAAVPDKETRARLPLGPEEGRVLAALSREKLHIDDLSRNLAMDVARLSALLVRLELHGLARRFPGMLYALAEG